MRKIALLILGAIVLSAGLPSCSKSKSVQEYLREQQKAIDRFIDQEGFKVIDKYPKNGVFKSNEYYLTNEGVYMNVVDTGNGAKVTPYRTIAARFEYQINIKGVLNGSDTTKYVPTYQALPYTFVYGPVISSSQDPVCEGWVVPLGREGVTEGAIVNLIIPCKKGTSTDKEYYIPRYYKNLEYTSFDAAPEF